MEYIDSYLECWQAQQKGKSLKTGDSRSQTKEIRSLSEGLRWLEDEAMKLRIMTMVLVKGRLNPGTSFAIKVGP